MTTELEKQFFDTFGIEPMEIPSREYDSNGEICSYYVEYPQITDRILLELIRLLSNKQTNVLLANNVDELKEYVLDSCIKYSEDIEKQVQALFEEEQDEET